VEKEPSKIDFGLWYTISRTKLTLSEDEFWLSSFDKLSTMWDNFIKIDPNYITPEKDNKVKKENKVFIDEIVIF
jgi:hypothetical protein